MEQQTRNFKYIGKLDKLNGIIKKLDLFQDLTLEESEYILTVSIISLNKYKNNHELLGYLRFSYYIILHYTVITGDYRPLLDFSVNLGLYPIAHQILKLPDLGNISLFNGVIDKILETEFLSNIGYIQTLSQKNNTENLIQSQEKENAYIAPTSYGKSEIILDLLKENDGKMAVIVPTKSLLIQTYKNIRKENINKKIILHEGMYSDEDNFIAILTQERALRFIENHKVPFDIIMIDEAHNILDDTSRSILLTRLIKKNYRLNNNQRIYYFSPLINNVDNIKINNEIKDFQIKFDMKEPQLLQFYEDGVEKVYNRYLGEFFVTGIRSNSRIEYIKHEAGNKNFIFSISPKKIAGLAKELSDVLDVINSETIEDLKNNLKAHVHEEFEILDMLDRGVIYLHGQMPDIIKEYLEMKFDEDKSLKFLVANMVILEGINLPIDRLFINSCYHQDVKKIVNLIGRVNRLKYIFQNDGEFDVSRLLPKISFLNENSKIENLRVGLFKDEVKNPILENYEQSNDSRKEERNRTIIENENFILREHSENIEKIKYDIINLDINRYYTSIDALSSHINELDKNPEMINFDNLLEEIYRVFFEKEVNNICNFEIRRLIEEKTRKYYSNYLKNIIKKSLNEKIKSYLAYFIERSNSTNDEDYLLYVGKTYGEVPWPHPTYGYNGGGANVCIDLRGKSIKQLVSIAISKINLEENFISYDLTKFVEFLYKNNFITESTYNLFIYGTEDEKLIKLTKTGLSMSLVQKLDDANQIDNLNFDNNGNLVGNDAFNNYVNNLDDFDKFEVTRYVFGNSQNN